MKVSRAVLFWIIVVAVLVFLELAEVTHLFHLGYTAILGNLISFIFSLVIITILALVGAVFVGIFIAHRILQPRGFSPFEEEMLRMRGDVQTLVKKVDALERELKAAVPGDRDDPPKGAAK